MLRSLQGAEELRDVASERWEGVVWDRRSASHDRQRHGAANEEEDRHRGLRYEAHAEILNAVRKERECLPVS